MKTDVERDHRCERERLEQETNMTKRKKSSADELKMGRRGKAERGEETMVGPLSAATHKSRVVQRMRGISQVNQLLESQSLHQDTKNLALCRNKMTPFLCMCEAVMKSNKTHAICGI